MKVFAPVKLKVVTEIVTGETKLLVFEILGQGDMITCLSKNGL